MLRNILDRKSCLRWWAVVLCLLSGFLVISPSAAYGQENLHKKFTKEHPLIYVDAWDLWPYVFLDANGQPEGYNIDLLTMILDELNIPFEIHLKPTSEALKDLRDGKADLMMGMVAKYHDDYVTHYGKLSIQLFTPSIAHPKDQKPAIKNLSDLAINEVIVHDGSFSHHLMQDHGWDDKAVTFGDMDKAVQLVSAENSGQILWNTMSLKWLINQYNADNLELSPVDIPSGDYRFMSNDEGLLNQLETVFTRLKADDKLVPLEQKWFYPEQAPIQKMHIPRWMWYVVAFVAASLLLLIGIIISYRIRERNATRRIRQHTQRLAVVLSTCKVNVWTFSVPKRSFIWYNENGKGETYYSLKEFATRHSQADMKRLVDALDQIARQECKEKQLELTVSNKDDKQSIHVVHLSVLRMESGVPSVIIGTENDVTEERAQQDEDNKLIHRYRAVFSTSLVDMVSYDKDGYIMDMNQRAQKTFQMDLNEVLKEHVNFSDIYPTEFFNIKDFDKTDHFNVVMHIDYKQEKKLESRKREGTIFYELQLVPVYDNNHQIVSIYGTGREVTEVVNTYRKAKQGVRLLRKGMEEVSEHVNNINYAMQVGGVRMIDYSPQTHLLTIYHRMHQTQFVLTQQRCISLCDPDFLPKLMHMFRTMDRRSKQHMEFALRTRLPHKGGGHLWLQSTIYPVLDKDGQVATFSGILRDTTDMMHTEHLLQQETEKAQEIEQVKTKFLHNMCYEIRTPLNIVVGFAEMFEKEHSKEEEEVFIQEIKKNTAYLLNLINDILFLSRLDARMVEINPQPTDFSKTFEGHCHLGWANKQKEGVDYIVENQFEQLVVNIDDSNLGLVIRQVVENAATYTSQGFVRVHYEYIGGKLVVAVDDSGDGIKQELLEHLFERFSNPGSNPQGTGLGLPICKELVSQMGGTIDINSEVGKGTTVWVTIPCEATVIEHKKTN